MSEEVQFALAKVCLICVTVFGPISFISRRLPMKIWRVNLIEEDKVISKNRRKIGLRVGILVVYCKIRAI